MRDKETNLTLKQLSFVKHFCGDCKGNATKSAKLAGYKYKNQNSISQRGAQLVRNSNVKAQIDKLLEEIARKIEITTESIAEEIAAIAFGRITFTVGFQANMANKLKALELLGRYKAMFTDKVQTTDIVKQRELDHKEAEEAAELARLRLAQKYGLIPASKDINYAEGVGAVPGASVTKSAVPLPVEG